MLSVRRLLTAALAAALMLVLVPGTAKAIEWRSSDQGGDITIEERVNDNLFVAGDRITVRGTIDGDLWVAGNQVEIEGRVTGDVYAAGAGVTVSGDVGGDVYACGNQVRVSAPVGGDMVAAGQSVTLAEEARVGRDAVLGATSATLRGDIGRNVWGGAQDLAIAGSVGGNVSAEVADLTLQDGAEVSGDVSYRSDREAEVASGAQVRGDIERRPPRTRRTERPSAAAAVLAAILAFVRSLVAFALLTLAFTLLAPLCSRRSAETLEASPLASIGIGFAVFALTPFVAGLVFVFGLFAGGWWLGLMLLAAYWIAIVLGVVVAAVFVGGKLLGMARRDAVHPTLAGLLGILVLLIVGAVPFVGWLVMFVAMLFGLGALVLGSFRHEHGRRAGTTVPAAAPGAGTPPAPASEPPGAML